VSGTSTLSINKEVNMRTRLKGSAGAVALVLLVIRAGTLVGQESGLGPSAPRIRVTLPDNTVRVGRLIARRPDSLLVTYVGDDVPSALSYQGLRVDVSEGEHRNVPARIGHAVVIGVVGGAVIGALSYEPCSGFCIFIPRSRERGALVGAGILGVLAIPIGAIWGYNERIERWRPMQLGTHDVSIGPFAGSQGIGVTLHMR
jgi:hypothetical protein